MAGTECLIDRVRKEALAHESKLKQNQMPPLLPPSRIYASWNKCGFLEASETA
jgi:hypothetical protein